MNNQPGAQEFKLFETGCALCGYPGFTATDPVPGIWHVDGHRHAICKACLLSDKLDHEEEFRRRKASPPAESRAEMPEVYGTMPDVLPETLPAGTRWRWPGGTGGRAASSTLELRNGNQYWAHWEGETTMAWIGPDMIVWSEVPKPGSAKKLVEPRESPVWKCSVAACGRPTEVGSVFCADGIVRAVAAQMKKPDPYAIVRERHDYVNEYAEAGDKRSRETRIAAMSTDHPLSRLAARKQRQRAEVLADISRPRTYRDRMGVERTWDGRRVKP